jgi:hypothetical protein
MQLSQQLHRQQGIIASPILRLNLTEEIFNLWIMTVRREKKRFAWTPPFNLNHQLVWWLRMSIKIVGV